MSSNLSSNMPFMGHSKLPIEVILCGIVPFCTYKTARNLSIAFFINPDESSEFVQYLDLECDFDRKFRNKLLNFGIVDIDKFYDSLKKYNAVVSGSIVLGTIIDGLWDSGDIDIYINKELTVSATRDFMLSMGFGGEGGVIYDGDNEYTDIDRILGTKLPVMEFVFGERPNKIGSVYTIGHRNGGCKIQLIRIDGDGDILSYIDRSFDFGFCKNIYNGKSLITMDKKSVIMKSFDIRNCGKPQIKLERVIKYSRRGFKINGVAEYYMNQLSAVSIEKLYNARIEYSHNSGFIADFNADFDWYMGLNKNQGMIFISNKTIKHFLQYSFISLGIVGLPVDGTSTFGKSDVELIEYMETAKNGFGYDFIEIGKNGETAKFFGRNYNVIELILSERLFIENFDGEFVRLLNFMIDNMNNQWIIHEALFEWANKMIQAIDTKKAFDRIKHYIEGEWWEIEAPEYRRIDDDEILL